MSDAPEAILFDLDDTLLDGGAAWRSGMDALLVRCPEVDRAVALRAWDVAFEEHFARYLAGELTFAESRIARIRSWSDLVSVAVPAGDELLWFDDFLVGYEAGWAAFEDVEAALGQLRRFRLGVITNGDGDQQRAKLIALGLGEAFEVVICSGDVGFAKPDPRIFELAAARLGVPPNRCLFVGDRRDSDALGAVAAGMSALWLNRKGQAAPDELVSAIVTLGQLPALMSGHMAGPPTS
jgi:putative hydrolase of the HAD superfamily